MPGPTTEVLSDDVKDLRTDLHKTEVALSAEIHRVDNAVGKLSGEFAFYKWLTGATFATVLTGVVAMSWTGGTLSARVGAVEARLDKMEGRLDRMEAKIDRIEAGITKAIGQSDKGNALTTPKR